MNTTATVENNDASASETKSATLALSYSSEMLGGLYAVLQHASKDAVTPVITGVLISASTFLATDRYTIGQWEHEPAGADSTAESIIVPRSAVEWLLKQTLKALDQARLPEFSSGVGSLSTLIVEITETHVSVLWRDGRQELAVMRYTPIKGNFPPVDRLIVTALDNAAVDAVPTGLSGSRLVRFANGAKKVCRKDEDVLRMTGTKTDKPADSDKPAKPGPVLIQFGEHFTGLIQPNLLLR